MFNQKEKRAHYNAVAKGEKPIKNPSKFEPQRQKDYARGQADARNEAAAIYMHKKSTPEQRETYKAQRTAKREASCTGKCKVCGKPCAEKYPVCYGCFKAGKTAPPEKKTAAAQNSAAPKDDFYKRYLQVKAKHGGAILFFRLGDFYEILGEDAKTASKELDLTLVTRSIGDSRIPMCGVPYHALDRYIAKLVEKGFKVAVAE